MTSQQNKHPCPICHLEMVEENRLKYIDYYCKNKTDEHSYGARYVHNVLTKVKIRFKEPNRDKFYIKFHYDQDFMEVWSTKYQGTPEPGTDFKPSIRTPIAGTIVPDYTDIDKFKQKIRTYLIFS